MAWRVFEASQAGTRQQTCSVAKMWSRCTPGFNSTHIDLVLRHCSSEYAELARHLPDLRSQQPGEQSAHGRRFFAGNEIKAKENEFRKPDKILRELLEKWHYTSPCHGLHELMTAMEGAKCGRPAGLLVRALAKEVRDTRGSSVDSLLVCSRCREHFTAELLQPPSLPAPIPCQEDTTAHQQEIEALQYQLQASQQQLQASREETDRYALEVRCLRQDNQRLQREVDSLTQRLTMNATIARMESTRSCGDENRPFPMPVTEHVIDGEGISQGADPPSLTASMFPENGQSSNGSMPSPQRSVSLLCPKCQEQFEVLGHLQMHVLDCLS